MRRMVRALLSSTLLLTGAGMTSYGAVTDGTSAVGPGVKVSVGESDFLNPDVVSPIVKSVKKYSFEQMGMDIQALQQAYRDKMIVSMIGASRDERNIYDITLGNPQTERQILIQGAIHVREYMTPLLMMSQLGYTLTDYDTGHYNARKIGNMLKKVAIHLVPMANPDGVTLDQLGADAIRSEELKQTIRECYDRDTQMSRTTGTFEVYLIEWEANAAGVDLNYSFPTGWDESSTKLMAPSLTSYKGPSPFLEPETQAFGKLAGQYPWAITISYHSQGKVAHWTTSENEARMASNTLADSISVITGYRMDSSGGKGGSKDWMQSRSEAMPGVTIEVGKTPCPVSFEGFAAVWKQNRGVWVQTLDYIIHRTQPVLK